jgi:AcrR family transcriptional regulator
MYTYFIRSSSEKPYGSEKLKERTTALRKDAQERLDRLIDAAVELYASEGHDVPLEKIAERAGVSRPTLHRNFPDRDALSAAVLKVHMEELTSQIAQWADRDDCFFLGLKLLATKTITSGGLAKILPMRRQAPASGETFRLCVEQALAKPLARAKAIGLVRQEFTFNDMHRAILMLSGGGLDSYGSDIATSIELSLDMLRHGMMPSATSRTETVLVDACVSDRTEAVAAIDRIGLPGDPLSSPEHRKAEKPATSSGLP